LQFLLQDNTNETHTCPGRDSNGDSSVRYKSTCAINCPTARIDIDRLSNPVNVSKLRKSRKWRALRRGKCRRICVSENKMVLYTLFKE
jgi:hypothetical protein